MEKKSNVRNCLGISTNKAKSSEKRHKKHKKHKHRHTKSKKTNLSELFLLPDGESMCSPQPSIKLKIKFGGQTVGTQSFRVAQASIHESEEPVSQVCNVNDMPDKDLDIEDFSESLTVETSKVVADSSGDDDTKWLDALEAGDLDDNGELKRKFDSSLLTARQRALLHGECMEELVHLPTGYKDIVLTDEQLKGREIQANKRRQLALEKTEKHKKQTIDRLLKKQEAKSKAIKSLTDENNHPRPMFRFIDGMSSIAVGVPHGFHYPLNLQMAQIPKPVQFCGVQGCNNVKKYVCSKSGFALCSLQCYQRNQQFNNIVQCT